MSRREDAPAADGVERLDRFSPQLPRVLQNRSRRCRVVAFPRHAQVDLWPVRLRAQLVQHIRAAFFPLDNVSHRLQYPAGLSPPRRRARALHRRTRRRLCEEAHLGKAVLEVLDRREGVDALALECTAREGAGGRRGVEAGAGRRRRGSGGRGGGGAGRRKSCRRSSWWGFCWACIARGRLSRRRICSCVTRHCGSAPWGEGGACRGGGESLSEVSKVW